MKSKLFFILILLISSIESYGQVPEWAWAKSAGGAFADEANCVTTDNFGNVYITGSFNSSTIAFGSIVLNNADINHTSSDIFIAKYDTSGNIIWAKRAGGIISDVSKSITTDNMGNIYISGSFNSYSATFGNITLSNSGNSDLFIAKYDNLGNVLWVKSAMGTENSFEQSNSITTDNLGNVYITGNFNANLYFDNTTSLHNLCSGSQYCDNTFIAKYDALGNFIWAKQAEGFGTSISNSIAADNSNNIYITGQYHGEIIFGNTTLSSTGIKDVFITKFDAMGNVLWAKSGGGTNSEQSKSIATDNSGNVYISGEFDSPTITFGNTTLTKPNINGLDIFITKYNSSGNVIWAKGIGENNSNNEKNNFITTDNAGNIYITGEYNDSITFGNTTLYGSSYTQNMYIAKLDFSGNALWAKSSTQSYSGVGGNGIAIDNSQNIYLTGNFRAEVTLGSIAINSITGFFTDAFLAKLSNICIIPPPTITPNGPTTFCAGGSVTLTSSAANSYLWSNMATTQSITAQTSGVYWVRITDANGCTAVQSIEITTLQIPSVSLGNDTIICSNQPLPITLNAGNTGCTYHWSTGATNQTITVSSSGTYSVVVTNANICTGSDAITITYNSIPNVNLGDDITTCSNIPITLNAGNAGSTYHWNTGATSQTISVTSSGTYIVVVTNANTCTNSDAINVTFSTIPIVNLGNDTIICTDIINPIFNLNAGNAGATYLWNTGATSQTISVSTDGNYSVLVTNSGNCTSSDEINIDFKPAIYVNIGKDTIMCPGELITLSAGTGYDSYLWSDGSTYRDLSITIPGIYSIVVKKEGCYARDEIKMAECASEIWFPNVFTPNSDGINDSFYPIFTNIDKKTLIIYNRFGNKIFEGSGENTIWNGKHKGEFCSEGVYYFIFNYEEKGDNIRRNNQIHGSITVLK